MQASNPSLRELLSDVFLGYIFLVKRWLNGLEEEYVPA
jgi:hypothetical protein